MHELPPVPAPHLVGRYRLIRCIGAGGMGTVFEAEHAELGRRVAIKFLRNPAARPRARFEREARLLSRLEHENIVTLLDLGKDEVLGPYLVLEYLSGRTLRQELDELGIRPLERVQSIVAQIGRGLSAAHRAGIVHRDLKPENVMLTEHADGSLLVKLLDFGVARESLEGGAPLTATDAAVGTAAYMSPEQAAGKRRIDERTDIYSLAVIVYECLAGRRPYQGESYNSTLFQILNRAHRPLAELRTGLPRSLADAVERALAKRREDRPSDVAELVAELTKEPGSPLATPTPAFEPSTTRTTSEARETSTTWSSTRRGRRAKSPLLVAVLLMLVGVLTVCLPKAFDPAANARERLIAPSPAERVAKGKSANTTMNPATPSGLERGASTTSSGARSSLPPQRVPPMPKRQPRPRPPGVVPHSEPSVSPSGDERTSKSSPSLRGYLTRNPYDGAEKSAPP